MLISISSSKVIYANVEGANSFCNLNSLIRYWQKATLFPYYCQKNRPAPPPKQKQIKDVFLRSSSLACDFKDI